MNDGICSSNTCAIDLWYNFNCSLVQAIRLRNRTKIEDNLNFKIGGFHSFIKADAISIKPRMIGAKHGDHLLAIWVLCHLDPLVIIQKSIRTCCFHASTPTVHVNKCSILDF